MVDPIDRSFLRKPSAVDEFGRFGNLSDKREKPFVRKSGADLLGSSDKFESIFDDRKNSDTPARSFLKKSTVAQSDDVTKPSLMRSRPESPAASSPRAVLAEERKPVKIETKAEPPLSHEPTRDVTYHRINEAVQDAPAIHSRHTENVQSPRDKLSVPAAVVVNRPSDPERERNSRQVHYSATDDDYFSQRMTEKRSPRSYDRSDDWDYEKSPSHPRTMHDGGPDSSEKRSLAQPSQEKSAAAKPRPKSSNLWEKIKRREQKNQQLRERGFFEHAPPDFVDMSNEPEYCGDRDKFIPAQYPKRRTLFYSKKGGDASYIDVVAEVQKEDGDYVDIQPYDEPVEPRQTLCMKYGKAVRGGSARQLSQYASDDYSVDYSVVNNTKELRQVVYEDWLARKSALVRVEQKHRQALKKEEARRQEDEFKNKLMASKVAFMHWKKDKEVVLTKKKAKEAEDREKEIEKLNKKAKAAAQIKQYIKVWVNERPKSAVDAEKQAIERRRQEKIEKMRMEEEEKKKKELSAAAFKKWQEEKQELVKKQQIEMAKQLKAQKMAEFAKRLERDKLAVTSYEQWLEIKEKQISEETKLRRTTSAMGGGSMGRLSSRSDFIEERPPWFPASRTVPRKLACPT